MQDAETTGVRICGVKKVCFTEPVRKAQKKTPRHQMAKPLPSDRWSVLRTTDQDKVCPSYLAGNKKAPMAKIKLASGITKNIEMRHRLGLDWPALGGTSSGAVKKL